jgi:2,3-bisphosphoglycerate-independent phosphoglycerate mutase
MANKPVILIILDGWGIRQKEEGNAVVLGNTPNYDRWMQTLERAVVHTSGEHVGLVPDQMGNSEVGHLNLGAGRIVYQDITRIDIAIRENEFGTKKPIAEGFERLKETGGKLHLIGLLGRGGVHSHQKHLHALIDVAQENDLDPVIHVITDGRDTPTQNGIGFLADLNDKIAEAGVGRISTVSGRYHAMDRDRRWERTEKAYNAIAFRKAEKSAPTAKEAIQNSYDEGTTDEFIEPAIIGDDDSLTVDPGDMLLFYNFRSDRMRQLTQAFTMDNFEGADHFDKIDDLDVVTMTEYMDELPVKVVFPVELLHNTLAEWLSKQGLKQYHSAETEKYPHVTFFFNGRMEEPWPGEDRRIIPSPKVATYDLQPEMSAPELTRATLERIQDEADDFILVNFANPDMVGHTGDLDAAIKAVETVDECAGKLVDAVLKKGGAAIITADHGNCERMLDLNTGQSHTYHTVGPVSLFVTSKTGYYELWTWGRLADVAPTVLDLLDVVQPSEMTGRSLIKKFNPAGQQLKAE